MTERAVKLYLEELKIEIITAITEQVTKPNKQYSQLRKPQNI
ncbi:hypothetical protein [Lysinibacillus sp. JK80]|nr:hypothetical protein [Lysinibacillus sp. JK80]